MTQETDAMINALVNRDRTLFGRLVAFNFSPADYVHPSRRAQFADGCIADAMWNEARARKHLSVFILRELQLQERPCMALDRREWPVAMLDRRRLERLARYIGAVLLGSQIRRSLTRDEVLRWQRELTIEAYQFVMTSASLLKIDVVPADPLLSAEENGFGWIAASMAAAPDELTKRIYLKFPHNVKAVSAPLETAQRLVISILSALEPQWCSLFATIRN